MARSIWNGTIAFATVRVPVKLYAASESKAIRFRERHGKDGAQIEHRRVCEEEDREIPYSEVVKGLESSSGEYVVLSKEEVAAADGPAARTIEVEHFARREQIDPLYFDHPYYLGPGADAQEGYLLLHAAMRRSDRVAIGRFVFHNKAQLVAMRPYHGVLAMHTMRFADELVSLSPVALNEGEAKLAKRELDVAHTLLSQLESRFEPRRYKDTYREAVLKLIERKAAGESIAAPVEDAATPQSDLLAVLEASVKQGRTRGGGTKRSASAKRASSTAKRSRDSSTATPRSSSTAKPSTRNRR
ncbi:MAG: non-homologous end joining protein Ku [Solirubrobacteraceae bacterium]